MNPTDAKRRDRVILGCVGTCVLVPLLALVPYLGSARDLPFEPAAWRAADLRTRGRMIPDLLQQRALLIGRTEPEVVALLGPHGPDVRVQRLVYDWEAPANPIQNTMKLGLALGADGRVTDVFTYD